MVCPIARMNIHDFDWRIEPLHDVIVGIEGGLKSIRERLDDEEGVDGLSALERAEPLLGLGFVAFQIYAVGTWTDLNSIRKSRGKRPVSKWDCYKCDSIKVKGDTTSGCDGLRKMIWEFPIPKYSVALGSRRRQSFPVWKPSIFCAVLAGSLSCCIR
jgi:hypothetical protein